MSSNVQLDPYVAQAQNDDVSTLQKIEDLNKIVQGVQAASSKTQINLLFFANNSSPKFQEIRNDNHVNLSFFLTTSHWASISGIARVIDDRSVIKKYWSPDIGSYFGDLGDGIHKGNEDDPRVAIIEVVPDEVRYWLPTSCPGVQKEAPEVQGKVTVSGELRTITKEEIQVSQGQGVESK